MWIKHTETQQAEQNNFPISNSLCPYPSHNLTIPRGSSFEAWLFGNSSSHQFAGSSQASLRSWQLSFHIQVILNLPTLVSEPSLHDASPENDNFWLKHESNESELYARMQNCVYAIRSQMLIYFNLYALTTNKSTNYI